MGTFVVGVAATVGIVWGCFTQSNSSQSGNSNASRDSLHALACLHIGMTQDEVLRLLGEPIAKESHPHPYGSLYKSEISLLAVEAWFFKAAPIYNGAGQHKAGNRTWVGVWAYFDASKRVCDIKHISSL